VPDTIGHLSRSCRVHASTDLRSRSPREDLFPDRLPSEVVLFLSDLELLSFKPLDSRPFPLDEFFLLSPPAFFLSLSPSLSDGLLRCFRRLHFNGVLLVGRFHRGVRFLKGLLFNWFLLFYSYLMTYLVPGYHKTLLNLVLISGLTWSFSHHYCRYFHLLIHPPELHYSSVRTTLILCHYNIPHLRLMLPIFLLWFFLSVLRVLYTLVTVFLLLLQLYGCLVFLILILLLNLHIKPVTCHFDYLTSGLTLLLIFFLRVLTKSAVPLRLTTRPSLHLIQMLCKRLSSLIKHCWKHECNPGQ
ncbi:hypothetical protein DPEC_G00293760, partial [Dallia pectoralis]